MTRFTACNFVTDDPISISIAFQLHGPTGSAKPLQPTQDTAQHLDIIARHAESHKGGTDPVGQIYFVSGQNEVDPAQKIDRE
jgi:hypothetical protein